MEDVEGTRSIAGGEGSVLLVKAHPAKVENIYKVPNDLVSTSEILLRVIAKPDDFLPKVLSSDGLRKMGKSRFREGTSNEKKGD